MVLNVNNLPAHGAEAFGEHLRMLQQVIGPIPTNYKFDHPYNQSRAYSDLTELLIQRAPRVVEAQIHGLLIEGYHSELLHNILPIRLERSNESLRIEWSEIKFDAGLAPAVAVEGIAPVYTHNKSKHAVRAVRRAAGIRIESTFFQTEEGQREWQLKIQQLAAIIQRTNEYDAMMTLLQAPFRNRVTADEMNGPYNVYDLESDSISFMERLKMEVEMFGIVNLTVDSRGFANLCTSVRTAMKRHHVEPDYLITPPLMIGFYFGDKDDLWHCSSAGPQALQNRENAADIGGNGPIRRQSIQGMKVVDMHLYRPTNDSNVDEANDLLTTRKQIGEFYCCKIDAVYDDLNDLDSFRGNTRDLRIFNEKHGVLVPVRYSDMLRNCLRWGTGREDPSALSEANRGRTGDLFLDTNGDICEKWFDMKSEFMPGGVLERVSRTLAKLAGGASNVEKLTATLESLDQMNNGHPTLRGKNGVRVVRANDEAAYQLAKEELEAQYGAILLRAVYKITSTVKVNDDETYVRDNFPTTVADVFDFVRIVNVDETLSKAPPVVFKRGLERVEKHDVLVGQKMQMTRSN